MNNIQEMLAQFYAFPRTLIDALLDKLSVQESISPDEHQFFVDLVASSPPDRLRLLMTYLEKQGPLEKVGTYFMPVETTAAATFIAHIIHPEFTPMEHERSYAVRVLTLIKRQDFRGLRELLTTS